MATSNFNLVITELEEMISSGDFTCTTSSKEEAERDLLIELCAIISREYGNH